MDDATRGQRVYGKSHPTRESIDLNLLLAPLIVPLSLNAPISRSRRVAAHTHTHTHTGPKISARFAELPASKSDMSATTG